MRMLDLFSGIGGISLAAHWAGIEVVAHCEIEPFPQKVLRRHWPHIPIYEDVRTLTKERLEQDGIIGTDRTVELICGGYPCQPFSVAGNRKGEDDDRHLWPEIARLLQEIRPNWFIGENVAGHITLGLDDVLDDLERLNYSAQSFVIPACGVGSIHKRDRIFIVANSNEQYVERGIEKEVQGEQVLQRQLHSRSVEEWTRRSTIYEPKLSRTFNGIPNQVDRIIGLGNAVVPQQIYPILRSIKLIHEGGM